MSNSCVVHTMLRLIDGLILSSFGNALTPQARKSVSSWMAAALFAVGQAREWHFQDIQNDIKHDSN